MDSKRKLEEGEGPQPPKEAKMDDNEVEDGKVGNDVEQELVKEEEEDQEKMEKVEEAMVENEEETPKGTEGATMEEDKVDYFTQITFDCMLEVAMKLNYFDLNQFALMSKKTHAVADYILNTCLERLPRSHEPRSRVDELNFSQGKNGDIKFELIRKGEKYNATWDKACSDLRFKRVADDNIVDVGQRPTELPQRQTISREITTRATQLLCHFTFITCKIRWVSLDDNFLKFIKEVIIPSPCLYHIELESCSLEPMTDSSLREGFLSLIRPANVRRLSLLVHVSLLNKFFFKKYDEVNEECLRILNKIDHLTMDGSMFVDGLHTSILDRMQMTSQGCWEFRLPRAVDWRNSFAVLPPGITANHRYGNVYLREQIRSDTKIGADVTTYTVNNEEKVQIDYYAFIA